MCLRPGGLDVQNQGVRGLGPSRVCSRPLLSGLRMAISSLCLFHHLPPRLCVKFPLFTRTVVTVGDGPLDLTLITSVKILMMTNWCDWAKRHPYSWQNISPDVSESVPGRGERLNWLSKDYPQQYWSGPLHSLGLEQKKKREEERICSFCWFGASISFLNIGAPGSQTLEFRLGLTPLALQFFGQTVNYTTSFWSFSLHTIHEWSSQPPSWVNFYNKSLSQLSIYSWPVSSFKFFHNL